MTGTIVNTIAIIAGSLAGLLFRKGIPAKFSATIVQAIGLAVILVGLQSAFKSDDLLLIIICLAGGSLLGEWLGIETRLEAVGRWFEARFSESDGSFAKGFVTATLVYCVGSMAIVGSMESGLSGNHQTLYAKSMLDGIMAVVFTSTLGVGVMLSAVSVFIYQGLLTGGALMLKPFLVPEVVNQMSAVGGLLIVGLGINLLEIRKISVGNMLPAIFLPLLYYVFRYIIQ
ncbi:MAG: DUF554 domain-containing protein [Desulfobacterales bacterium]|nr:DUF554 domain-containing protein [Desulfobacterales bacterium]